jgi:hypothetical protein
MWATRLERSWIAIALIRKCCSQPFSFFIRSLWDPIPERLRERGCLRRSD